MMRIDHIGYVVNNLQKSSEFYCNEMDYEIRVPEIYVENQSVKIIMLQSKSHVAPDLELISPVGENSPVRSALKRGIVINHICYRTERYDEILNKFRKKIVRPSMPAPAELFGGGRTFFAYLNGQVTEFVEDVSIK